MCSEKRFWATRMRIPLAHTHLNAVLPCARVCRRHLIVIDNNNGSREVPLCIEQQCGGRPNREKTGNNALRFTRHAATPSAPHPLGEAAVLVVEHHIGSARRSTDTVVFADTFATLQHLT
ncbi:MAG: hypothetical protein U1U88_000687 [Lawsonella clevelandensis]